MFVYNSKINKNKFVDNASPAKTETNDCLTIFVCLLRAFLLHISRELYPKATYLTFLLPNKSSSLFFFVLKHENNKESNALMTWNVCDNLWILMGKFLRLFLLWNTKKHFLLKFSSRSVINNEFLSMFCWKC